ncbi:metal ABC transporter ATP-binding protein [Thiomicrorhabdus heinhorstiae]|uniref:Metal ABC transporter ATP-binding protein n=1 Tax=Thiomicrorhabdus heinhorstiae TaxID=2748010 RepID=A0ABS0BZ13_9GAMM|nr:metal ABC transporter ATP-binding protein [Thiomicrorhabdus heinhorstiae]MBF6057317.1 metal ABC transporter ATP-binding protein [Thiomicrorhabdus heinhorstiae]
MSPTQTIFPSHPPLSVKQLSMRYHHKPVLTDVSFSIPEGKTIAIVGPNGAGKSSLLKGIMGLESIIEGEVKFFGEDLNRKRLATAYVPQREEIDWDFPINVMDVVLMGRHGHLSLWKRPSRIDRDIAEQALKDLNMWEFRDRQISQLSGGQQQRVFLARALAQQANLYLMDEPFAGVDVATEKAIIELFSQLKQRGKTIVCVHHDLNTVGEYFDWIVFINARLVAAGPVEEVLTPENLAKTYGGRLSLLNDLTEQLYRSKVNKIHDEGA